jgi:hypothetical protein
MSGGDVMVLIAVAGQFALVGLIVWIVARRLEQKAALRAQLELKLIERFSSAKELEEFLSSEAGRRLFGDHPRRGGTQLGKIVGTVQIGVALLALGIGVLLIAMMGGWLAWTAAELPGPRPAVGRDFILASAILILAIGFGLLAAAAVGRRLVRAWALNGRENGSTPPTSGA